MHSATSEPCNIFKCLPQMAPPAGCICDALFCRCDRPVAQNQLEECINKLTKSSCHANTSTQAILSRSLHGEIGAAHQGGCPSFSLMSDSLHSADGN